MTLKKLPPLLVLHLSRSYHDVAGAYPDLKSVLSKFSELLVDCTCVEHSEHWTVFSEVLYAGVVRVAPYGFFMKHDIN